MINPKAPSSAALALFKLTHVSSGHPEDPLNRGPGSGAQRQVPRRDDQRQVGPVWSRQGRDPALPEQGHPREGQSEVERSL